MTNNNKFKRDKLLGVTMLLFAFAFDLSENIHFGWNIFPQSEFEFMCDLACLTLGIEGIWLLWRNIKVND